MTDLERVRDNLRTEGPRGRVRGGIHGDQEFLDTHAIVPKAELTRLREEAEDVSAVVVFLEAENARLHEALREIASEGYEVDSPANPVDRLVAIARTAISEVEGEK